MTYEIGIIGNTMEAMTYAEAMALPVEDKKKIILVSRLGKFFSDFELDNISILQEMGYEVWCAGNFDGDNHRLDPTGVRKVHFAFVRNPLSTGNLKEAKKLSALMSRQGFSGMHCNMPVGGVMARLAAHKAKLHPVIYTAHGFQFCQGGPKKDWLLFYPVEKFLSRYTDYLITINEEDYALSQKMHAKHTMYIPGVGVDTMRYSAAASEREALCEELGISEDAFLFLSVGELSVRKNHEAPIRGLAELLSQDDKLNVHYIIAGIGALDSYLRDLVAELGISDYVHFLGWRDDIARLNKSCDVAILPSKREGLPVALLEALAAGRPCIAAKARGNTELVLEGENGFLVEATDPHAYADAMKQMMSMDRGEMSRKSLEHIKKYDIAIVHEMMKENYERILGQ